MERKSEFGFSLLAFGGFVVIVGFTLFLYPETFTEIRAFFDELVTHEAWVKPSDALLAAAALFVISLGVLNFVLAALRLTARHPWYRALQDASWGIALVFLGYLIVLYAQDPTIGPLVAPMFIILAGILIVANALFRYLYARNKGGSEISF